MAAIAMAIPAIARPDVMLWGCSNDATVDGIGIQTYLQTFAVDDDNWNAVRVKMVKEGSVFYLGIWDTDSNEEWEGDWGVELGDSGSGQWGVYGVQSSVPNKNDDVMEVLFQMELGHNTWSDSDSDYVWTTLATTESVEYKNLVDEYTYERFSIAPPTTSSWMPTEFHTIPEPSSSFLLLMGIGLLALRRGHGDC